MDSKDFGVLLWSLTSIELKWSATLYKNMADVRLLHYVGSCKKRTWHLYKWNSHMVWLFWRETICIYFH